MSAVAVLLLLSVGCADALPPQSQPTATSARVTLAPGEDASTLGGAVTLRFDDVVSDSRCPTSEQCVWAGRAEVALTVTARGASASYRVFAPGASPTGVAHEDLYIELLQLDPHPKTSRGIANCSAMPTIQAKKFDPDGAYLRRWVPEYESSAYPPPIVGHGMARRRALAALQDL